MAGFGGAVKLTGESEYRRALSQITQSLKVVSAEMKATSTSFANGDKSTKELANASKTLKDSLEKQKSALTSLKSQLSTMQAEYKKTASSHQALLDKYNSEKRKLEEIGQTLGTSSKEYKNQQKVVNDLGKEVTESTKKYESQGKALNDMRIKTANAESTFNQTSKALKDLGDEAQESGNKARNSGDGFTVMRGALANLVSQGISRAVSGLKELGKATFMAGMNFEQGMSEVSAISGATGNDLKKLTDKAMEMGNKTKFSATEASEAFKYMAMAGWKTEDMLGGISGVMALASASGEDLASVSDIVTDALTAMGYSAKDAGHFADVLASASTNANTNVGLMGNTFQYVAPIAGAMGYSIEDLGVAIGLMASASIKGEKAGTALRSILTRLSAPPKECADAMEALGISIKNADGTMKPLKDVMEQLRGSFSGLSNAQQVQYAKAIAGQEAMSGLLAIVNASPQDYDKLTQAIQNCDGASEKISKTMTTNVSGSITELKSKIENKMIRVFQKASDSIMEAVKKMSQALEDVDWDAVAESVGKFAEKATTLFAWILKNGDKIISIITGIVAGFVAFKTVTGILTMVESMKKLVVAIQGVKTAQDLLNLSMMANPIGLIVGAITGLIVGFVTLWNTSEGFRNFWIGLWDNIKEFVGSAVDSIVGFFTETIPKAIDSMVSFFSELPSKIGGFLVGAVQKVIEWRQEMIEKAIDLGQNFLKGIVDFFEKLPERIGYFIGFALGKIVQWGVDLYEFATTKIPEFVSSIVTFISELPSKIWTWLVTAYNNVTQWGANMIAKGIQTGSDFVSKVITFIKELPSKAWTWLNDTIGKAKTFAIELARKGTEGAKNLVTNIVNGVRELPSKMLDIGKNVVKGIWNGIKDMGGWIKDKISGFCGGIVKGFKKALGIHSPSRVLKDSVGKYMAMGIGVGFEDEMANVTKEMQNAIPTSFDVGTNLNGSTDYNQTSLNQMDMVGAFKDALSQMKIELDDEVAGKFVEKTVARAIYT